MKPARHTASAQRFHPLRGDLNTVLAFAGYELTEAGAAKNPAPVATISQAAQRAGPLRAVFRNGVFIPTFKGCRPELIQKNYFHVVLEATKTIAQKLRDKTGLTSDGAELSIPPLPR